MRKRERIYLDYAATTPVDQRVFRAMRPYLREKYGNPSSLHSFGQDAIAAVDRSREAIAKAVEANFREIIFTGSATEANNLALRGVMKGLIQLRIGNDELESGDPQSPPGFTLTSSRRKGAIRNPKIVISSIEHESVLATAHDLEREGFAEVVMIPVDRRGIINLDALRDALDNRTVMVSVMYVNNEVGSVQPIAKIAKIIEEFRIQNAVLRKDNGQYSVSATQSSILNHHSYPLFHTDAAQAFAFFNCSVVSLGVDLMTLSAHKMYGPKGVGALYVRRSEGKKAKIKERYGRLRNRDPLSFFPCSFFPLITGGGQEFGLRSGTENVAAIVGFARAVEIVSNSRGLENRRIEALRDRLWRGIKYIYPRAQINGAESITKAKWTKDRGQRLSPVACRLPQSPHILNVYFPGRDAQDLLTTLDLAGVAASSGSACTSRAHEPSHVLRALGYSEERVRQSVRFSVGRQTTASAIDRTLAAMRKLLSYGKSKA